MNDVCVVLFLHFSSHNLKLTLLKHHLQLTFATYQTVNMNMTIPATICVPKTDDEAVAAVIVEQCCKSAATQMKRNTSLTKRLKNLKVFKRGKSSDDRLSEWLKFVEEPSATYKGDASDDSELSLNHDDDDTVVSWV